MRRTIARLPEDVEELCLIRLGFRALRLGALPYARRLSRRIDGAAAEAGRSGAGLLGHERFAHSWRHFGVLQYWRSFDALEDWSHRPPHSEWWREAVERGRARDDFGLYHEVFLVPRANFEAIYLNGGPVGVATFGTPGEPVGPLTTSRDRLGRRRASRA